MSDPTPTPVDLADIDLTAPVMCEAPGGCGRQAEWQIRSRCKGGHRWLLACDKHVRREMARPAQVYRCVVHGVLIPAGQPVEWRPL